MTTRWWAVPLLLCACAKPPAPPQTCTEAPPLATRTFGHDRPVTIDVPSDDDPSCPLPLVLLLHGYGADGALQRTYFGLDRLAELRRVILVAPDGKIDSAGLRYWNATDACCDEDRSGVDDVAYLTGLVDEIGAVHALDRSRIWAIGHSNGAFMAYRLACERADMFAAIAGLAGATYLDTARCAPSQPVSVLHIHGDHDQTIEYDGGMGPLADGGFDPPYPGAVRTVDTWAAYDGCSGQVAAGANVDVDNLIAGAETTVLERQGCPSGIAVDLWTIPGGGHIPPLARGFLSTMWGWLTRHPKP